MQSRRSTIAPIGIVTEARGKVVGATGRTIGMATPPTTVPGFISTSVVATDTMVIAAIIDTTIDTSNFKLVLLIAPARRLELGQSRRWHPSRSLRTVTVWCPRQVTSGETYP